MSRSKTRLPAAFLLPAALLAGLFAPAAPAARAEGAPLTTRILTLAPGDTLTGVLAAAGVDAADAQAASDALAPLFPPRELQSGQEMALDFSGATLRELRLTVAVDRDIVVDRAGTGSFAARQRWRPLTRVPELAAGVVRTSLFEAAEHAGVPRQVLSEMIRAFSYDVDFQRELKPDDSFEVLYERLYDRRGTAVGTGEIAYAAMTLSGRTLRLYRYRAAGAAAPQFFTAAGASVKKALLKTPIDGARLSSGFGMRRHPILGFTKMHRGVDFAAPAGTPIMAAGDGVVERAGAAGAYGNLVLLRHDRVYETGYAHMSRIAALVRPGAHVRQGEIIGYVGATGRATGPHLHYEVRMHGAPINPMTVRVRPGLRLAGEELARFRAAARTVDRELLTMRAATIVAGAPEGRPTE